MEYFQQMKLHPKQISGDKKGIFGFRWNFKSLLLALLLASPGSYAFQYRKDTMENCSKRTKIECQESHTLWFECPVTCSEHLQRQGNIAEIFDDPESFFELTVTKADGQKKSLEDYEGYVTVFSVIPSTFPGMSRFYYDVLEHIASVYPFTVQFVVLPWQSDGKTDLNAAFGRNRYKNPRVVLLEEVRAPARPTEVLDYLLEAKITAGNNADASLWDDRVTTFLVSADGMFLERLISPTITLLERRIAVYLQQLSLAREL